MPLPPSILETECSQQRDTLQGQMNIVLLKKKVMISLCSTRNRCGDPNPSPSKTQPTGRGVERREQSLMLLDGGNVRSETRMRSRKAQKAMGSHTVAPPLLQWLVCLFISINYLSQPSVLMDCSFLLLNQ